MGKHLNKESYVTIREYGEIKDVAPLESVKILYNREKPTLEIRRVPGWNER